MGHCAALGALQHLETSNCWHLTDSGLNRLTCLTALAHLDLSYCWQVGTPDTALPSGLRLLKVFGCCKKAAELHFLVHGVVENP